MALPLPPLPAPDLLTMARPDTVAWAVRAAPLLPTPVCAAALGPASPETLLPAPRAAALRQQGRPQPAKIWSEPLVTVTVRSDGQVESVTFVLSSGAVDIDEMVQRIIQSQAPYPPFQPALAREFDVIEIRRNWNFDTAVRLH